MSILHHSISIVVLATVMIGAAFGVETATLAPLNASEIHQLNLYRWWYSHDIPMNRTQFAGCNTFMKRVNPYDLSCIERRLFVPSCNSSYIFFAGLQTIMYIAKLPIAAICTIWETMTFKPQP